MMVRSDLKKWVYFFSSEKCDFSVTSNDNEGLDSLQEMECHINNCKIYAHQFLNVSSIIFCIIHKVPVFSVFLLLFMFLLFAH